MADDKLGHIPFPRRAEQLRLLASWRFPDDPQARAEFLSYPPKALRLSSDEFGRLAVHQKLRHKLRRAQKINLICESLTADDPRQPFARRILHLLPNALWLLERGQNADMSEIERLCGRADVAALGPIAARAPQGRGRKPGAVDLLGRTLIEFLATTPATNKDVLAYLRQTPPPFPVVAVVTDSRKGIVIIWRNAASKRRFTTWRSIWDTRLPHYRAPVKNKKSPNPPTSRS